MRIAIAGAGVFGLSAAVALRGRGHRVMVLDPGPLPRAVGSSVDSSRAVRADYGRDAFYSELAEAALDEWRGGAGSSGRKVFHADGFLLLTRSPMRPGEFEHDSYSLLVERGLPLDRLDERDIARRFPVFSDADFVDGYFNPSGGWVDAAAVMESLVARAAEVGVDHCPRRAVSLLAASGEVRGVRDSDDLDHPADLVLIALGAWTPAFLPWLSDRLAPAGQPVTYFNVGDPAFHSPSLCPFGAEIARTGWYGFPAHAGSGLKIANHGPGLDMDVEGVRVAPSEAVAAAEAFVAETFPRLSGPEVSGTKVCFYCDSFDGDFWIDHDPDRPGLMVAAGGSGHAFKFAPLLGEIIANVAERRADARAERFRWRERGPARAEGARRQG